MKRQHPATTGLGLACASLSFMERHIRGWTPLSRMTRRGDFLGVFLLGLYISVTRARLPLTDETWFLQVLHRVQQGDILYRDVFFGVTPLSAYLALGPVAVLGTELIVLKLLAALCFSASVFLASRIVRQCGAASRLPIVAVGFLLVYGYHGNYQYSALAYLCLLGCCSATLSWAKVRVSSSPTKVLDRSWFPLIAAGLWAGLCFSAKQNIGAYVLGALMFSVAVQSSTPAHADIAKRHREFVVALGAFAVTVAGFLLPVALSGAIPGFWAHAFANKALYLQSASSWYPDGLAELGRVLGGDWSLANLRGASMIGPFLLLVGSLMLATMSWLWPGRDDGPHQNVVLSFVGAGILGIVPSLDQFHVGAAATIMAVGCMCVWPQVTPRIPPVWRRAAHIGLGAWVLLGLGSRVIEPPVRLVTGQLRLSDLPHLHGILVPTDQHDLVRQRSAALRQHVGHGELLILDLDASLYYLVGGLRNPTPFDYPLVNSLGPGGQQQVIAAIDRGEIRDVCLPSSRDQTYLTPLLLDRHVREHLQSGPDVGLCEIFSAK